jgi:hypothetical protein
LAARGTKLEIRLAKDNYEDKRYREIMKWLTPSEEEQTFLILQGKCPHNKGWRYAGHGHNDDAYDCNLCGETKWH